MKKLWIIGDSFSTSFYAPNEGSNSYKNLYGNFKGYTPKFFGDFISEQLDIEYEILTTNISHDNFRMMDRFIENVDRIKDGDIFSFGWTSATRLSFVNTEKNEWVVCHAPNNEDGYIYDMSSKSLIEWAINRDHPLYIEQLKGWMKLIDISIPKVKVVHWSWTNNSYFPFESIAEETNKLINDAHWSENGHKQFAEWFLGVYNGKIKNNCYETYKPNFR
jgi:hypothetical protein